MDAHPDGCSISPAAVVSLTMLPAQPEKFW